MRKSLTGVMGIVVSVIIMLSFLVPASPVIAQGSVNLSLSASPPVSVSQNFTVAVQAQSGNQTSEIDVYLDFDPAYLRIVSVIAGTDLSNVTQNLTDNTLGTFGFTGAPLSGPGPSGNFTVVSLTFQALKATANTTAITFHTQQPRKTMAFSGQNVVTGTLTSGNYTITSGPATKLAFTIQPGGAVAGSNLIPQPVVSVQDAQGNLVASDNTTTVTLILTGSPSGAILSGTSNVTAVSGNASFNGLKINKAGAYTLTASSNPPLTGNTSVSFNITVGPASKLAFIAQPGGAAFGAPLNPQPVVAIQDAQGNLVTTDNSTTVTLSLSGNTSAVLTGTKTIQASGGSAVFGGLSVNQTGTYSLVAAGTTSSNTSLTPATSNSFTVKLGVNLSLSPATQSLTLGNNFTVTVQAQSGNLTAGDVAIYLNFDPSYLSIQSTTPGTAFANVLENAPNNTSGTLNFRASQTSGTLPSGNFTIVSLNFQALKATNNTTITFNQTDPRRTFVDLNGNDITGTLTSGNYSITGNGGGPGEIIITNRDSSSNPISTGGSTITVNPSPFGAGTLTVVDNDSNDTNLANGIIDLKNLPVGSYTVTQTVPPAGYFLPVTFSQTNTLTTSAPTWSLVFADQLGAIKLEVRDAGTGNILNAYGTIFTISPDPHAGTGSVTLNDNDSNDTNTSYGIIDLVNVLAGTYTVTQTGTPSGYFADTTNPRTATVASTPLVAVTFYCNYNSGGGGGGGGGGTTYPPTISSFTPTQGGVSTQVYIYGTNLNYVTGVSFGNTPAASFQIFSGYILAVTGSGSTGYINVSSPYGTTSSPGYFYFNIPPVISSFYPTTAAWGASVTITGYSFTGATAVSFGSYPAQSFNVYSDTQIIAIVGSSGSSGSITVTNSYGTGSLTGFTFDTGGGGTPIVGTIGGGTSVEGVTTLTSSQVDSVGNFLQKITASSPDNTAAVTIPVGVKGTLKDLPLTQITVLPATPGLSLPAGVQYVGPIYDIGPTGTLFSGPVTIAVSYDPAAVSANISQSTLYLAWYDAANAKWTNLTSTVDTNNKIVSGTATHFTYFTILAGNSPPRFGVSTLQIDPAQVQVGKAVTITVTVVNDGGQSGSYNVKLFVNNKNESTKSVQLAGNSNQKVSFSSTQNATGTYDVSIDYLSGSFTAIPAAPATTPTVTTRPPTTTPAVATTTPPVVTTTANTTPTAASVPAATRTITPTTPAPKPSSTNWPLVIGASLLIVVVLFIVYRVIIVRRRS